MSGRVGFSHIIASTLVSFLLTIMPLPNWLQVARPDWTLLLVIYWALNAPMLAGQAFAFFCGLLLDALIGDLIGQHAFAFLVVATLTQHFQFRIRVFPLLQQAVVILLLVMIYHGLKFWIDGIVGVAIWSWLNWLPIITGAILWPVMVAVLDTSSRQR